MKPGLYVVREDGSVFKLPPKKKREIDWRTVAFLVVFTLGLLAGRVLV
jgi:hypothetical protein